jgi:hypothetical protein
VIFTFPAPPNPWFSLSPRVRVSEDGLAATSSRKLRCLTLGLWRRQVVVSRRTREIAIHSTIAWFRHRRETIPFDRVVEVTYGWRPAMPILALFTYDGFDLFWVGVRLRGGRELTLFTFIGDAPFCAEASGLPDWWFYEEMLLDQQGTQEKDSREFANAVAGLLGVKVGPPGAG